MFAEIAALAGPIGNAIGGLMGYNQSRTNTQVNIDQARENRRWQEDMSNTAHQREVEDLKKAGLNPILSAKGAGAPVGSGAQGSAESMTALPQMDLMNSLKAIEEIKNMKATNDLIGAQTEKTKAETEGLGNKTKSTIDKWFNDMINNLKNRINPKKKKVPLTPQQQKSVDAVQDYLT